jgi:flagellar motor switch protein FliN
MSIKSVQERNTTTQLIELQEISQGALQGGSMFNGNFNLIQHLKVKIAVRVGGASITVGELFALKEAAVIKLDQLLDDPVDILLEGQVIARGRLVAVDDYFGISVTELPQAPKA